MKYVRILRKMQDTYEGKNHILKHNVHLGTGILSIKKSIILK